MSKVWCVSSGKGGVGKTFISSGLGISLAKLRKKILLVDFDLSGANLHAALGCNQHRKSILDYLESKNSLEEIITKSTFSNVDYIAGFNMPYLGTELGLLKAEELVKSLKQLNYDIIIFDLGAGAAKSYLNLMNFADKNLLVTNCEPGSLEKTYKFIDQIIEEKVKIPNLELMINSCRSQQHKNIGQTLEHDMQKKHGIHTTYAGFIQFDNAVWQSTVSAQNPINITQNVFTLMPYSTVCHDFYKISKQFIDPKEVRAVS
ncbi:MAG: AAA family ATPase [Pseudobdellovibrio sp.]